MYRYSVTIFPSTGTEHKTTNICLTAATPQEGTPRTYSRCIQTPLPLPYSRNCRKLNNDALVSGATDRQTLGFKMISHHTLKRLLNEDKAV